MTNDSTTKSWDEVAAELRACREAQQRAWGDIDNATLGRFLANELHGEERNRVENALEKLPELRKLVDLVGDVLGRYEPEETLTQPEPAVLPMPAPRSRKPSWIRLRQRSALVAAACLLILLGVAMPLYHSENPDVPRPLAASEQVALGMAKRAAPQMILANMAPRDARLGDEVELQLAKLDRSLPEMERQGKVHEVKKLVEEVAANVNLYALQLRQEGDVDRAEPLLVKNYSYCRKELGGDHPETQRCLSNLAGTYQVALAFDGNTTLAMPAPEPAQKAFPNQTRNLMNEAADPPRSAAKKRESVALLRHRLTQQSRIQLKDSVVPVLTEALRRAPTPQDRAQLANSLGLLGQAAAPATELLEECCKRAAEPHERQALLQALEQVKGARTFRFTCAATVAGLKPGQTARVWLPVPPSNADQNTVFVEKDLPAEARLGREPQYGNEILSFEAKAATTGEIPLKVVYKVTRREVGAGTPDAVTENAEQLARLLSPDRLVPTAGKPLELIKGKDVPADEVGAARLFYEAVNGHMRYSKEGTGWGRGDAVWACESGRGNCSDFHSLFISLARARKIPAKFEIGFPLPPKRGAGEVTAYHCWAKFRPQGKGWIPVDISEANKHPDLKEYYFGHLTADRVAFSTGRDLDLVPRQAGEPLNLFVFPYVEVEGKPWPADKVVCRFSYRDEP
jgi:transglutaminase-like putative cysteine protease